MKALNLIGTLLDRVVWTVGIFTILDYSRDHWPVAFRLVPWVAAIAALAWFSWRFVYLPFRAGLRG